MALAELSPLDEERFGIRTAKALVHNVHEAGVVLDDSRKLGARFVIIRCPSEELRAAQVLEQHGARLMDVLVYFSRDLAGLPIPQDANNILVRPARRIEDADAVAAIARESFKGYFGHYHADPHIDPKLADDVYVSWARRSCLSREVADEVLVAEDNDVILAFITLRMNAIDEGEAVVGGVSREAQGHGIYRSFIIRCMEWCRGQGASRMVVSTQITNTAVQKVWTRLGFEPQRSYLTFHQWFDDEG
jgi:GNAT superfamily N-acetyltransferase